MTKEDYQKRLDDGNFPPPPSSPDNTVWHDARKAPFSVHGVCDKGIPFRRIPEKVAEGLSSGGYILSSYTTGVRVRFTTDSAFVAVKAKEPHPMIPHNMTVVGADGFDLFCDGEHIKALCPPQGYKGFDDVIRITDTYRAYAELPKGRHVITLFLPLYTDVYELEIGLSPDAFAEAAPPYTYIKPIVFYGSSIVHGAGASAPGNNYPAMLSRFLDSEYINLGLSGHAFGEACLADYIASLSMSIFVYDYDHNAPTAEHLRETHEPMFRKIREKNPTLPIIMASRPYAPNPEERKAREEVIEDTYRHALASGDKNVYFVHGDDFFRDFGKENCMIDGIHPNDIGYYGMAKTFLPIIKSILEA